jgi:hypothetical protein
MKQTFVLTLIVISLMGCDEGVKETNQSRMLGIMQEGTWRISYYYDTSVDETAIYSNYTYEFDPSSILSATDGANSFSGTWGIIDTDPFVDTLPDLNFNILFSSPPSFAKLSANWKVIEATDTKVKLSSTGGSNGGTDYLTFDRK